MGTTFFKMVQLFKDIDWKNTVEQNKQNFTNFEDVLKSECNIEQESLEFKGGSWRMPISNTSFANFVI